MKIAHLLNLLMFQTHMTHFLLWNIKADILKKVDNQTGLFPIDFHCICFPYNGSQ